MEEFESPTVERLGSSKLDNKQKQNSTGNLRNSTGKITSDNSSKIQPNRASTGNIQSGSSLKRSVVLNGVKDDDSLRNTMKDTLKADDLLGEKKRLNRSVIVERKTIDTKKDMQNQFNSKSNLVRLAPETPRDPKQKVDEIKKAQLDKRTTTKIDAVSAQKKFDTNNSKVSKGSEKQAENSVNNSKNSKPMTDVKSDKSDKFERTDKRLEAMKIDPSEKKEINAKIAKAQAEKKEIREIKVDPSERDRKATLIKKDDNKSTTDKNIASKNSQNSSLNTSLTAGTNDNKIKSVTTPSSNENKNYPDLDVKSTGSAQGSLTKKENNTKIIKYGEESNKISENINMIHDNQTKSNVINGIQTKLVTKNVNEIKLQQDSANGDLSNELASNENSHDALKEKKKKLKKSTISREDNSVDTSQELDRKRVRDRDNSRFSSNDEKFMVRSSIFGSRSSSMIDDQLDRSYVNLEADPFDPSGGFAEIRNIRNILKERADDSNTNKNLVGNKSNDDSVDLFKHPAKNCRNIYIYYHS